MTTNAPNRSRTTLALLGFALALLVACSLTAFLVARAAMPAPAHAHGGPTTHQWLHNELALDAQQREGLDAMEAVYQQRRLELQQQFDEAKQRLAAILTSNDRYSSDVTEAVEALHIVHGQLQELAIRHYYDMLAQLSPEQQDRLKQLAIKALSNPQ